MNPRIKQVMYDIVEHNPYISDMAISLTEYEEGYAKGEMCIGERHLNPYHCVHGGALYTLADVISGCAACSCGKYATTVTGNMNYLKPAMQTGKIYCEARAVRDGKQISVYDVCLTDDRGELVETGTFTFYIMNRNILEE